jgi:hypothetical protein
LSHQRGRREVILVDLDASGNFERYIDGVGRHYDYAIEDGTPVPGEFEAMARPGFVLAGTPCQPGGINHAFNVGVRAAFPADDKESVQVLSELIQPLMREVVDHSYCTPGQNPFSELTYR